MENKRNKGIYIKLTQQELELIDKGMKQMNVTNRSAFIRKMAINGYIINLDIPELKEIQRLLSITSNNVNQIARRVNQGSTPYGADLADLTAKLEEVRLQFGEVLQGLARIQEAMR